MSQFDQIGQNGVPSYAKPITLDPSKSVLANVSVGNLPMNAALQLGCAQGANTFGGNRTETVAKALSTGAVAANGQLGTVGVSPSLLRADSITQITASIAGTTMTVTANTGLPSLGVGTLLAGPNLAPGTSVTALGTGNGGPGTYTVTPAQTVPSQAMTPLTGFAG
jgi:hypothetical protein